MFLSSYQICGIMLVFIEALCLESSLTQPAVVSSKETAHVPLFFNLGAQECKRKSSLWVAERSSAILCVSAIWKVQFRQLYTAVMELHPYLVCSFLTEPSQDCSWYVSFSRTFSRTFFLCKLAFIFSSFFLRLTWVLGLLMLIILFVAEPCHDT